MVGDFQNLQVRFRENLSDSYAVSEGVVNERMVLVLRTTAIHGNMQVPCKGSVKLAGPLKKGPTGEENENLQKQPKPATEQSENTRKEQKKPTDTPHPQGDKCKFAGNDKCDISIRRLPEGVPALLTEQEEGLV